MSILLMMTVGEQEVEDCIGCYLFLLNDVNKSGSLSRVDPNVTGWEIWERGKSLLRVTNEECEQLLWQSPHLEWGSWGWAGEGAGGYSWTTLGSIDDVTSTVGWWDEQNVVSYGDDDILFQYFTFKLLILPSKKLIIAVLSTLQWHVI